MEGRRLKIDSARKAREKERVDLVAKKGESRKEKDSMDSKLSDVMKVAVEVHSFNLVDKFFRVWWDLFVPRIGVRELEKFQRREEARYATSAPRSIN